MQMNYFIRHIFYRIIVSYYNYCIAILFIYFFNKL